MIMSIAAPSFWNYPTLYICAFDNGVICCLAGGVSTFVDFRLRFDLIRTTKMPLDDGLISF